MSDRPEPQDRVQGDLADPRAGAPATSATRRGAGAATTIGGILVGFDEEVWNRRPPAQEQVVRTDRATRVSAPGGRTIELPPTVIRADPPGPSDDAERPDAVERRAVTEGRPRAAPSGLEPAPDSSVDGHSSHDTS